MTARDPDFVRRQLLANFDNPPQLTFTPPGFTRLDYRRPDLERSEDAYADFDDDARVTSPSMGSISTQRRRWGAMIVGY